MRAALAAGVRYFLAVFALGFALGTLRTLFLAPRLGETVAVLIELPVMLTAAWLICGVLLRRHAFTARDAALMGATAFVLLMLAEACLSVLLAGRSLAEHFALYAALPNQLGLAGQIAFALIPLIRSRRRQAA